MKKLLSTSLLALALMAGTANSATLLEVVNASNVSLANYDLFATTGLSNDDLVQNTDAVGEGLKLNALANLTFTYLGFEAGFHNVFDFTIDGSTFTNYSSSVWDSFSKLNVAGGGFLPFKFVSVGAGENVINGNITAAIGALGSIAFYVLPGASASNTSVLALFNDLGGPDADWDDMVIRIDATFAGEETPTIPLPAGFILLLSGLTGLGFLGRSRAKIV